MLAKKNTWNSTLDFLRIFAIIGVVLFHMLPSGWVRNICYGGLVYFLLLLVVFIKDAPKRYSIKDYVVQRSKRLLLPWLFWLFFYGFLNLLVGNDFFPLGEGVLQLFAGSSLVLWFLPFAFFLSLVAYFWFRILIIQNCVWRIWISAILSIIALVFAYYIRAKVTIPVPLSQWVHALPCLPVGFFMAYLSECYEKPYTILTLLGSLLIISTGIAFQDIGLGLSYCVGIFTFYIGIIVKIKTFKFFRYLSSLSFGVYLVHPLLIAVYVRIREYFEIGFIFRFTAVLALSFCLVIFMKRLPILHRVV